MSLAKPGGIPTPSTSRKSLAPLPKDQLPDPDASPDFKVPTLSASSRKSSLANLKPSTRPKTPTALASSRQKWPGPNIDISGSSENDLAVGDKVTALEYQGILRFLGQIGSKPGTFGGIELTGDSRGKGKNNGSVNEVKYFECDPLCGIFVPAAKIVPAFAAPELPSTLGLPRPASTTPNTRRAKNSAEASKAAEARINPGSRAARYLGMTASQLTSRQGAASQKNIEPGPSTPTRLTHSTSSSARNSPEKATPRAPKPRVSLGATPTRKSAVGVPNSAQQQRSVSGLRRPASRASTSIPDVPSIPSSYAAGTPTRGRRTPSISSSASGRATPSMDPNSRRYSGLESFGSPSRPATPARSVSRQSNASERRRSGVPQYGVRPSSRASVFDRPASRTGANQELQDEVDRLQSELSAALKSIEDSRISHLENDRSLKASQARFEEVSRRLEQSESELKAAVGRAQKSEETERIRLEAENKPDDALQAQLTDLQTQLKTLGEAAEESKSKLADQISASEALQQKFDNAKAESEKEKLDLNAQLDTLREAGQDLCAVYEERLREVEEDKQAIQRALQDREADLSAAKEKAQGSEDSIQPPLPPNAMPQTSPAAMAIDNENLRADNEHMRDRIHKLEEQLDDLRYTLESETDRAREKRVQGSEVEATLRQEIEELKSTLEKAHKGEGEVSQHIQQLETALKESQRALENERAELETLRVDSSTSGHAEKTAQLQRQLTAAQDEAREAQQHAKDLEEEISLLEDIKTDQMATQSSETSQQIEQLQSDLKAKTEEVEALQAKRDAQFKRSSSSSNYSSLSTRDREDVPSLKDQIVGLKVIIGQLTDENQELSQQNKDLLTQADTLREAQKALETTVDSLMNQLENEPSHDEPESPTFRRSQQGKEESNSEDEVKLHKKLADMERRKNQEIDSLNQELAELEAMVESKIYREDELEGTVTRYRNMLAKHNVPGFTTTSDTTTPSAGGASESQAKMSNGSSATGHSDEACELCGDKRHDLLSCPLMNNSVDASTQPWCDNCEKFGHSTLECESADDVF